MKKIIWILLGLTLLLTGCNKDTIRADRIVLIAELPNTEEFTINGVYVDIGIAYNVLFEFQITQKFNPNIFSYNKQWVLFSGSTYWIFDKEILDEIAGRAGIILQSNMRLPFWQEWGGKIIIIGFIIILMFWFNLKIWSNIKKNIPPKKIKTIFDDSEEHNQAELIFLKYYKIKMINSFPVEYELKSAHSGIMTIPAGNICITLDYDNRSIWNELLFKITQGAFSGHSVTYGNNWEAKGIIEAGKKYIIKTLKDYKNNTTVTSLVPADNDAEIKEYLGKVQDDSITSIKTYNSCKESASLLLSEKKYDEVILKCNEMLKLFSIDDFTFNCRGNAFLNKGEFESAVKDFDMAISLNPKNAVYYNDRGSCYFEKQMYDEAIKDFSECIKSNPGIAVIYINRAFCFHDILQYDEAIKDFSEAIRLEPDNDIAYFSRGLSYSNTGKHDLALEDISKAIELYPHSSNYYNNRAEIYEKLGNKEMAAVDFEKAQAVK